MAKKTSAKRPAKTSKRAATKRTTKPAAKTAPRVRPMNKRLAKMTAEPVKTGKADKLAPMCLCGCGQCTRGGDFKMGHDAKLKSALMVKLGSGFGPALAAAGSVAALGRKCGYVGGREPKPAKKAAKKKAAAK